MKQLLIVFTLLIASLFSCKRNYQALRSRPIIYKGINPEKFDSIFKADTILNMYWHIYSMNEFNKKKALDSLYQIQIQKERIMDSLRKIDIKNNQTNG